MQNTHSVEQTIGNIFSLMTRYSLNPELAIAEAIEQQLQLLLLHPDNRSKTIREVCQSLSEKWHSISEYQYFDYQLIPSNHV